MVFFTKDSKGRFKEGLICVCGHIHWITPKNEANPMGIIPYPIFVENWCPDCPCEDFKEYKPKEKSL